MKKLIFPIMILLFCFSCNTNNLTKEEVLKICQNDKDLIEQCTFNIFTSVNDMDSNNYNRYSEAVKELESQGLIKSNKYIDQRKIGFANLVNNVIKIQPTELAVSEYGYEDLKFNSAKVLYSKGEVKDVLGISFDENNNEAKALLLISYKTTPFSDFYGEFFNPRNCNNLQESLEKEITLIKYDTGWRIKNEIQEEKSLFN